MASLAAVASTHTWTPKRRAALGSALAHSPEGHKRAIAAVVFAGQLFGEWPLIAEDIVAATFPSLQAALDALAGEDVVRPIDLFLARRVERAPFAVDDIERLIARPAIDRLPQTNAALHQSLRASLPPDTPDDRRADVSDRLAVLFSELGRPHDALAPAQESVTLRRRLADPTTGNPDRHTPDLAASLNNLAVLFSELGRPHDALAPAQEYVTLYRRLVHDGGHDRYRSRLASAQRRLDDLLLAPRHDPT